MTLLGNLPRHAWHWVFRWTAVIIGGSTLLSAGISEIMMQTLSQGMNGPGFLVSVMMPIILGGPTLMFCLVRQQQFKLANQRLHVLATTDWLTDCLNRRAFTHQVTASLEADSKGALLMIDADHFKQINDQHGHDRGDEVLILLVDTIRQNLRPGDLLGRLGGEEFGVFLPGSDGPTAATLAERIRLGIEAAGNAAGPVRHPLSVSIGVAAYTRPVNFSELFRTADAQLYIAKQAGRNCIALAWLSTETVAQLPFDATLKTAA